MEETNARVAFVKTMRKLSIRGIVCLMAISIIFTSVSDAAIDSKSIVGVAL